MSENRESGYGRVTTTAFPPRSITGNVMVVGAQTLQNIARAQSLYKPDTGGLARMYTTLASAVAALTTTNAYMARQTVTVTIASPGVFTTPAAHGLSANEQVYLQTTGALPTGLSANTLYYVLAAGLTATTFQLATLPGGTAINTSGSQSGTHTLLPNTGSQDTIYILPNHFETIGSATAVALNVPGLNVVGLGQGNNRPYFLLNTATTATFTINAPNVSIENIVLDCTGYAAIVSGLTVTAQDVHIKNCKFITNNATNQVGVLLTTNAGCDRLEFTDNEVTGTTDAGTTNALQLIGGNDIKILRNSFFGAYTTSLGPINNITTACLRLQIKNNVLVNATASSTKAIVLVAGTSGVVADNRIAILSGTAPITGAGLNFVGGNYYTNAVGVAAGTLL